MPRLVFISGPLKLGLVGDRCAGVGLQLVFVDWNEAGVQRCLQRAQILPSDSGRMASGLTALIHHALHVIDRDS